PPSKCGSRRSGAPRTDAFPSPRRRWVRREMTMAATVRSSVQEVDFRVPEPEARAAREALGQTSRELLCQRPGHQIGQVVAVMVELHQDGSDMFGPGC